MNLKVKRFLSVLITITLTISCVFGLSNMMERKYSRSKYYDFLNTDDEYDVFFLGSSHMIYGISPMDIWKEYGITSYNFGGYSNTMAVSYWTLMNVLDYKTPKVVVIDCYLIDTDEKYASENYSSIHNAFDAFPLSKTKVNAVYDLLSDAESDTNADGEEQVPIGLLFDFSVYHSRWNQLDKDDFSFEKNVDKGAEDMLGVYPLSISNDDSIEKLDNVGMQYLQKIIDECNSRGIKVLVTYLPSRDGFQKTANYLEDYLSNEDVDYINFMNTDLIDNDIDFSDEAGHLNPSGAKKISYYLADYLIKNYSLKRNEVCDWNSDYEDYTEYRIETVQDEEGISNYLMLLNDSLFECDIEASSEFMNDYSKLFDNINCYGSLNIKENNEIINDEIEGNVDAHIIVKNNNTVIDEIYVVSKEIIRLDY